MNFDECYKKLEEGTATQEEAAFVATEIVKAKKIMKTIGEEPVRSIPGDPSSGIGAILDSDLPSAPVFEPAEPESFQKARKKHNRNMTIRIIIVTLLILTLVAGGIVWYIFGTAAKSANKREVYTREQAVEIAEECIENYVGHDVENLMIHDIDRHLNLAEGISNATRVLEIELNDGVTEYEVHVNLSTGIAAITDIDN